MHDWIRCRICLSFHHSLTEMPGCVVTVMSFRDCSGLVFNQPTPSSTRSPMQTGNWLRKAPQISVCAK